MLASGGSEHYQSMLKPHPATVAAIVGTQERLPAIYAFYDRALVARGYTSGRPGGVGSAEFASWEWCGPGTYYRLSIDEEARAFEPAILGGRTYHTVFHATLRGRDTASCLPDPTPATSPDGLVPAPTCPDGTISTASMGTLVVRVRQPGDMPTGAGTIIRLALSAMPSYVDDLVAEATTDAHGEACFVLPPGSVWVLVLETGAGAGTPTATPPWGGFPPAPSPLARRSADVPPGWSAVTTLTLGGVDH